MRRFRRGGRPSSPALEDGDLASSDWRARKGQRGFEPAIDNPSFPELSTMVTTCAQGLHQAVLGGSVKPLALTRMPDSTSHAGGSVESSTVTIGAQWVFTGSAGGQRQLGGTHIARRKITLEAAVRKLRWQRLRASQQHPLRRRPMASVSGSGLSIRFGNGLWRRPMASASGVGLSTQPRRRSLASASSADPVSSSMMQKLKLQELSIHT